MALIIEQTPAEQPRLNGESACWWEKHGWVFFPINKLMKKQSSTKADYVFLRGLRAFLRGAVVIRPNVL